MLQSFKEKNSTVIIVMLVTMVIGLTLVVKKQQSEIYYAYELGHYEALEEYTNEPFEFSIEHYSQRLQKHKQGQ